MSEEVERLRQRAIYKLTMRYGKPYVRFNMAPKHTTNALIPKPVQALTIKIKESNDLPTIQRLAKAAEDIFDRRIDPNAIMPILNAAVKKGTERTVRIPDTVRESSDEESKSSSYEKQTDLRTGDALLIEENKALIKQVEALKKANEILRGQVKRLTQDKNLNKFKDKTLFKQSADNKTVIKTLRTEIFKLTEQNEKLETENKEYKENIGRLKKDLNSLKKFYGSRDSPVSSRPEDTFVEKGSADTDLQKELDERDNEIEKLVQEKRDCDETKDALNKAVDFAEKLDQSDKVIIEEKEKEIERLKMAENQLRVRHAKELKYYKAQIENMNVQLRGLRNENEILNKTLRKQADDIKRLKGENQEDNIPPPPYDDAVFAASVAEGLIPALPTIRFPERHEI